MYFLKLPIVFEGELLGIINLVIMRAKLDYYRESPWRYIIIYVSLMGLSPSLEELNQSSLRPR